MRIHACAQVNNTDAEGRLTLADALWYAQVRYPPDFPDGCLVEPFHHRRSCTGQILPGGLIRFGLWLLRRLADHIAMEGLIQTGLWIVQEKCGVAAVVDIATLTGACLVALGGAVGGMFTPNEAIAVSLKEASQAAGEISLLVNGKTSWLSQAVRILEHAFLKILQF